MLSTETKNRVIEYMLLGIPKNQIAKILGIGQTTIQDIRKTKKKIMVISDLHCGHAAGLTPPKYRNYSELWKSYYDQWDMMWQAYIEACNKIKPDVLIVNGDATDGRGGRSGGSELIVGGFLNQAQMAADCIMESNAKSVIITYGTPYHTGETEDFESLITERLPGCNVKIGGHEFPIINGIQFDIKHKIGSSTVPHGRTTALNRSKLWNTVWNKERQQQPDSQILIRSHVHYHKFAGDSNFLAMTTPALQGWGSKYGVRQCEGLINVGVIWFSIFDSSYLSNVIWKCNEFDLPCFKVESYAV